MSVHREGFPLESASLREIFVEAGRAVARSLSGGAELLPATGEYEVVELAADDRHALLHAWIDELMAMSIRDEKVYTEFTIELLNDHELVAGVQGTPMPALADVPEVVPPSSKLV
jgi:hypothetical protein